MKQFQKCKEDFVCEYCGRSVIGNGYTNHCPECLWSKHVDVLPGDRQESCRGMMKPIRVEYSGTSGDLIHCCQVCGIERRNKIMDDDNQNTLRQVAEEYAREIGKGGV